MDKTNVPVPICSSSKLDWLQNKVTFRLEVGGCWAAFFLSCLESSECKADALEGKLAEPCVGFVPIPAGHLCTDLSVPLYPSASVLLCLSASVPLYTCTSVQLLNSLVMGVSPSLVVASLGLQILEFIWEFSCSLLCTNAMDANCQQLLTCGHRSPLLSSRITEVPYSLTIFLEFSWDFLNSLYTIHRSPFYSWAQVAFIQ